MKLFLLLVMLAVLFFFEVFAKFKDRKILVSKFVGKQTKSIGEIEKSRIEFKAKTLASLKALPEPVKLELLSQAERALKGRYPQRNAIAFMEVFQTNKFNYSPVMFAHRNRLVHLFIGHLLEVESDRNSTTRYLNEIVNGIWMLMETSTWCAPDSLHWQGTSDHLPLPGHNCIDLNVAKEIQLIGWIKLLIGNQLDTISPVINQRIDYELKHRVFDDYLLKDYGWAFENSQTIINNWNMMNNANILKAALFTLNDIDLFNRVLNKTIYSVDVFLNKFGDDGACDEGPGYWKVTAARLIEYLDALEMIFGESAAKYFAETTLLRQIVSYSYNMHITQNWYVNFADSHPVNNYPPQVMAKYGRMFNDTLLKQYAAYLLQFVQSKEHSYYIETTNDHETLNEFFNFVQMHTEIEAYKPVLAPEPELAWMPDIQVMTARLRHDVKNQIFLATKAGTNHESHNHNDVGSFILFQNGHPVLIDIGVGGYTGKTFSAQRYELFYMQSQYHNCPTINGVQQMAGPQYTSHNTSLVNLPNNQGSVFSSDIAAAYPANSHVKHWIRSVQFNRTNNLIQIDDQFELNNFIAAQQLHFIMSSTVQVESTGYGARLYDTNKVNMNMKYDVNLFEMKIDNRSLEGDYLTQFWGEHIQRITLTTNQHFNELKGHFVVQFVPVN